MGIFLGKLTLLDIGNNSVSAKGAFHVGGYIKKTKSLLWLNLYMNDIGDEVYYFQVVNHFCYKVILAHILLCLLFATNVEHIKFQIDYERPTLPLKCVSSFQGYCLVLNYCYCYRCLNFTGL